LAKKKEEISPWKIRPGMTKGKGVCGKILGKNSRVRAEKLNSLLLLDYQKCPNIGEYI